MKCVNHHKTDNKKSSLDSLELLAPAGGMEQLFAAINFGADAVYLGLDRFSMRAKASNFTFEELDKAVNFAHKNNVKVHVTLNTQIHESETCELPQYFKRVQQSGADAVIVGDIGAMTLANKYAPDVDLHVSTQSAVANSFSAKTFFEMGASRVVLAREMTLKEIEEFCKEIPKGLEVEAFVHGAQCMAQSGRCLISSYLCSGRSANRGECTQPCRWGFKVEEEKRAGQVMQVDEEGGFTYLFNAKDLCMIEHLHELKGAGVDSIKIEGRNKKAFYVATVVRAYRKVLNGADPGSVIGELNAVSHRPFSTGFYFGAPEQSTDFDGYTQETLHVADVLDCKKEAGNFKLKIRCRNKILEGEDLEALIPRQDVKHVQLTNFFIDGQKQKEVNRPSEIYLVESTSEVPANSYLRKREMRATSRMM